MLRIHEGGNGVKKVENHCTTPCHEKKSSLYFHIELLLFFSIRFLIFQFETFSYLFIFCKLEI